jgi:type III secretion system low calcium response chaperone LcrH/SycD
MALASQEISDLLVQWATGRTTLKEINGYTDEELYAISRVGYFFLMQGKNDEARTLFEGLVAIDPRNDYYYRALGVIFQKIGDNERAIRQFSYSIRVNPSSPNAYVNRAEIYLSLGQYPQAEEDLREALERMGHRDQELSKKAWALFQVVAAKKQA